MSWSSAGVKQWHTESHHDHPDNPALATGLTGQALTNEFQAAKDYVDEVAARLATVNATGGAYQAQPFTVIVWDPAGGAGPVILPPAPADKTMVAIKMADDGTLNVRTAGTDRFLDGSSVWPAITNEGVVIYWQYTALNSTWYAVNGFTPDAALQSKYLPRSNAYVTGELSADSLEARGIAGSLSRAALLGCLDTVGPPPAIVGDPGDLVPDIAGVLWRKVSATSWVAYNQTPAVPVAITFAADGLASASAWLHGSGTANGQACTWQFEYGTTTGYGSTAPASPGDAGTGYAAVTYDQQITGLTANTTYHYRFNMIYAGGTINGADRTFTTAAAPLAPTITQNTPTIAQTTATISGTIDPHGSAITSFGIQFGTTTGYGSATNMNPDPGSSSYPVNVSGTISGLTAGTAYHARITATSAAGTTNGPDIPFTTLPTSQPPTVVTQAADQIGQTGATLHGTVNPNSLSTNWQFQYGLTTGYGSNMPASPAGGLTGSAAIACNAPITGLTAGTTYHYRIMAVNSAGTTYGTDMTFATQAAGTPPACTVNPAITGTPSSGQVLTCSAGTWTGTAPISYAYQWKLNGTNIGGATASTYTVQSGDAGGQVSCAVTATNSAGNGVANANAVTISGGTGTLKFSADCSTMAPFTADGGWITDDTNTANLNVHYRGHVYWNEIAGGLACARIYLPEDPPDGTGAYPYTLGDAGVAIGRDKSVDSWEQCGPYIGMSMWVPAGGLAITGGGTSHKVNFGAMNFNKCGQEPITIGLYPDHMDVQVLAGTYSSSAGYQYNPNNTPQNKFNIFPVGSFVPGKWHSYVLRIKWEFDNTGEVQTWWRTQGGTWHDNGLQYSGAPTWSWPTGSTPAKGSGENMTQLLFSYATRPPDGAGGFSVWRRGLYIGDTFSVVANPLP